MSMTAFERPSAESLILVPVWLPNVGVRTRLALDTGASHTVIDLTLLLMAGYHLADAHRQVLFETAGGIVEAHVFEVASLTALGVTRTDFEVCSYDFFAQHILTEFHGMLGLDFLTGYKVCIDFRASTITLS